MDVFERLLNALSYMKEKLKNILTVDVEDQDTKCVFAPMLHL